MPKMLSEPEESENYFTPKEIIIINKDGSPVAKAVYEHLTKLNILLNDWENLKKKGVTICKSISDLKLFECDDDEYPQETELLVEGLLESLDGFEDVVEGVEIIKNQMQALSKLQTTEEPVINTWSCFEIAEAVANIWDMAEKEFRVKKVITENLAHSRDEKLLHVFMGIWEMEPYFKKDTYAYLFAEVGLT